MSWFTEIAGKAEDFLNKIDKNAADALNQAAATIESQNGKTTPRKTENGGGSNGYTTVIQETNGTEEHDDVSTTNHNVVIQTEYFGGVNSENAASSITLFDVPGADDSAFASSVVTVKEKEKTPKSKASKGGKASNLGNPTKNILPKQKDVEQSSPRKNDAELMDFLNDPRKKELDERLVLQTELANQSREVELLYKANKQLQSENESLKAKVVHHEQSKTKGTQMEEVESQLKQSESVQRNLKKMLAEKDNEIGKLKKSLDLSLEKLKQLEVLQSTQNRLEIVENENQKLVQTCEELNNQIVSLHEQTQVSQNQTTSMKNNLSSLEHEFNRYKEKAKSILKQKDDLISSLQEVSELKGAVVGTEDSGNQFLSEITSLKSERELLNAEISQCRATIESLREEIKRLESDVSTVRAQLFQTQKQITDEKILSSTLQDENLHLRQQLAASQFQIDVEKSERRKLEEQKQKESEENIQEKNVSYKKHQNSNGIGGDSEEHLRMRITALSQSLLEKQSLINNLSSDKQLLQINVERLQEQLRQGGVDSNLNASGFSQTVISNKPLYLSESPWDSGMSTGVKRAFSTVDSLCCQAGLTLRRRPNLRLGFCIYIIMLHFWVLFILLHFFNHVPHGNSLETGQGPGAAPSPTRK